MGTPLIHFHECAGVAHVQFHLALLEPLRSNEGQKTVSSFTQLCISTLEDGSTYTQMGGPLKMAVRIPKWEGPWRWQYLCPNGRALEDGSTCAQMGGPLKMAVCMHVKQCRENSCMCISLTMLCYPGRVSQIKLRNAKKSCHWNCLQRNWEQMEFYFFDTFYFSWSLCISVVGTHTLWEALLASGGICSNPTTTDKLYPLHSLMLTDFVDFLRCVRSMCVCVRWRLFAAWLTKCDCPVVLIIV